MNPRAAVAAILASLVVVAGIVMAAAPAEAASGYRYWSYWYANPGESAWTYGPVGPVGHPVDDGSVEGWRFVVAAPNPQAPQPRVTAAKAFKTICGGTARPPGKDRVAVVVDFGTASDSPPGESPPAGVRGTCAVVPDGSRGLAALSIAGYQPRMGGGLVCGLSGYPAHECGVVVKASSPTPKPSPTKSAPTKPTPTKSAPTKPTPTKSASPESSSSKKTSAASPAESTPATDSEQRPSGAASDVPATTADGPDSSGPALAVGAAPPPAGGSPSGTPLGVVLGGVLVLFVGGAALWRARLGSPRDAS